jgi:hypothetical protein
MTRNVLKLLAAAVMALLTEFASAQTSPPMTINVPQLNEAEF